MATHPDLSACNSVCIISFITDSGCEVPPDVGLQPQLLGRPLDRFPLRLGRQTKVIHATERLILFADQHNDDPPLALAAPKLAEHPGPHVSDSSADLEAAVWGELETYHHPVGTCRMGPATENGAVVDSRGAVHGVEGLAVVDASIMPTIPTGNTNLPTLMIGERFGAWLRDGDV